jgi:hypothetical protein
METWYIKYLGTTSIILFLEIVIVSKNVISKNKILRRKIEILLEYFGILYFFEMESLK